MAVFSIKKATTAEKTAEITVPLVVNTFEEDKSGEPITATVKHIFHIPNTFMREKHQQMLVRVRGNNIKAQGTTAANIWLWQQCIVRLEDYEDLPTDMDEAKKLFEESTILRVHAENAITGLLNYLNAEQGEISKK